MLARRLAQAADLLRKLVIPRLQLCATHALSQTCRNLRQTLAAADAELQALALVRLCQLQQLQCEAITYKPAVQAVMPAQHLASLAPGSTCLQQLQALAALHASIRLGQPAASELQSACEAELLEPGSLVENCKHALAANCTVIVWGRGYDTDPDPNYRPKPERVGVVVAGCSDAGGPWSSPQPSTRTFCRCSVDVTRDGRYCATVSETGCDNHTKEMPSLVARFFDATQRCWLPELHVGGSFLCNGQVTISSSGLPVMAACHVRGWIPGRKESNVHWAGDVLLVFEALQPCARLFRTTFSPGGYHKLLWLDAHSVVLLGWPLHSMGPQPGGPEYIVAQAGDPKTGSEMYLLTDSFIGTTLPSTFNPGCVLTAALSPATGAIWILHAKPQFAGPSDPCLSVYDACHLACLGTWQLSLKNGLQWVSLQLSRSVLAVSVAYKGPSSGTWVFQLSETGLALGPLLYWAPILRSVSFSGDGCFILGCTDSGQAARVQVLLTRNGTCLADIPAAGVFSASWSGSDPGSVLLWCNTADTQRHAFGALQF